MARRPNRAEVLLKKLRGLTPEERRIRAREAARAYANLLFGRPRRRLPKISRGQTDLAFETVEAYHERRMDDFAAALAALRHLSDVMTTLCRHTR